MRIATFLIPSSLPLVQVTWIRHRDVHILTVGEYTYTTDERFVARHNRDTGEWVLLIKYVQVGLDYCSCALLCCQEEFRVARCWKKTFMWHVPKAVAKPCQPDTLFANWNFSIPFPLPPLPQQERDAGGYECQIPSATPRSYKVNLNIVGEIIIFAGGQI